METCPVCKEWTWNAFNKAHVCAPKWLVISEGEEWDDAMETYAFDSESAAEKAADYIDSNYGEGASKHTLHVKRGGLQEIEIYEVDFDYSVNYRAEKKD